VSELMSARLGAVPAKHAQPDPSTLATLPKGGQQLSYMGHAEVTLALIDVDPAWTWTPVAIDPETGGPKIALQGKRLVLWGYLEVLGVSRLCVGTCDAGKGDPEKELIGDLLRNGAMRFGIGTKLWSKATDADPAGSGRAGGYERSRSKGGGGGRAEVADTTPPNSVALFERLKAAAGTPQADKAKEFAHDNGKKLNVPTFAADPAFAEQVAAILDSAS